MAHLVDKEIERLLNEAYYATHAIRDASAESKVRYLYDEYRRGAFRNDPHHLMAELRDIIYHGTGGKLPHTIDPVCNVILRDGEPLPEAWRGAEYGLAAVTNAYGYWRITFTSEWSDETLGVFLDPETHSSADAKALADVFLETINQRRLG